MISGSTIFLRRRVWFAIVFGVFLPLEANAAFNGLVPLSYSGRVSYLYGYIDSTGNQTEATSLLFGWGATGYIWRPWFATTSLALNVGLTSSESRFSSSEGTMGSGNFNLDVFSRSRFPFSMSYTRTDSRSQQFYDVAQVSGETSFRTARLTLRQSYRPRRHNQMYKGWYNSTQFDGGAGFGSNSEAYGLDYQLRVPQQTVTVSASRSVVNSKGATDESSAGVISAGHVYTPSAELGVSSLFSYVEIDPGGNNNVTIDSQAFSSFFWRPEHRAINVSGNVRLTENKTESGKETAATSSLNTNFGLGYRVTRALNVNASVSLGTSSSSKGTQSLSTTQGASITYSGGQRQWLGISHSWQWGASGLNSESRTDQEGSETTTNSQQSVSTSIGHNLGKSWATGRHSSLAATFSQSGSGSKMYSTKSSTSSKSLNHSTSLSWNTRGRRGSTYINSRLSDSRSFGINDTVFNSFSLNYATDLLINRLSNMTGNASYQASQNRGDTTSTNKSLTGGLMYRNARPFGIYNLDFTSQLQGSKQIDTPVPSTTLRWQSIFRYSLGLLSTSLSFRVIESAGGNVVKSMNFQATRTF